MKIDIPECSRTENVKRGDLSFNQPAGEYIMIRGPLVLPPAFPFSPVILKLEHDATSGFWFLARLLSRHASVKKKKMRETPNLGLLKLNYKKRFVEHFPWVYITETDEKLWIIQSDIHLKASDILSSEIGYICSLGLIFFLLGQKTFCF